MDPPLDDGARTAPGRGPSPIIRFLAQPERLDQFGDARGRSGGAVHLDVAIRDLAAYLFGDRRSDPLDSERGERFVDGELLCNSE